MEEQFIHFELQGSLEKFEEKYIDIVIRTYAISPNEARHLLSSVWLSMNDHFLVVNNDQTP